MGNFYKQWKAFVESMDKMGKKIDEAKEEFVSLTSTRKNKLEKQLKQIEELNSEEVSLGQENVSIDMPSADLEDNEK
jgi:DNA anti-recombination protein RmuC